MNQPQPPEASPEQNSPTATAPRARSRLRRFVRTYRKEIVGAVLAPVVLIAANSFAKLGSGILPDRIDLDLSIAPEQLVLGDSFRVQVAIRPRSGSPAEGDVAVTFLEGARDPVTRVAMLPRIDRDTVLSFGFQAWQITDAAAVVASLRGRQPERADTARIQINQTSSDGRPSVFNFSGDWRILDLTLSEAARPISLRGRMSLVQDPERSIVGEMTVDAPGRSEPVSSDASERSVGIGTARLVDGYRDGNTFMATAVFEGREGNPVEIWGRWCQNGDHLEIKADSILTGPARTRMLGAAFHAVAVARPVGAGHGCPWTGG